MFFVCCLFFAHFHATTMNGSERCRKISENKDKMVLPCIDMKDAFNDVVRYAMSSSLLSLFYQTKSIYHLTISDSLYKAPMKCLKVNPRGTVN